MKTYLIQRGKFENRTYKNGIDSIVNLAYMGSAEFEFGALPESLKIIRENIDDYVYSSLILNDKKIEIFFNKKYKSEIFDFIISLAFDEKLHFQEWTDFDSYINNGPFYNGTDFWWDIENHLMFWKESLEFTTKFKTLIHG